MNVDQSIKLAGIVIAFIEAISWPLIVLLVLIIFHVPLKDFIGNLSTLKVGPLEAQREQIEKIADSLKKAAKEQEQDDPQLSSVENTKDIPKLAKQAVNPLTAQQLSKNRILWVDDHPENNTYQRNALEALGIRFTIVTSTEIALQELKSKEFNAIISDMERFPDKVAGYTLLDQVKAMNIDVPFILYARGGNREERKKEALRRGAFASVSGPQTLFETVIKALEG